MALIVEDGTGKTDAESYITVASATARHANLGNAAWAAAASDTVREQALRKATEYMEQAYRERWQGYRRLVTQALSWPRWWVTVDEFPISPDIIPTAVSNACADLALRSLGVDLNADLTRAVVHEKVGPIETEYDPSSPEATRFRAIDMALAPYLKGGSAMIRLERS